MGRAAEPVPGSSVPRVREEAGARARGGRLFVLLCLAVALEAVGVGMLFPLLAKVQAAHHLPTSALGLMSGANFFAAVGTQIGAGRLLDGRRAHAVLLAGLAVGVVALAWFGEAASLWSLVAARALGGVSYGIVMPAALRAGTVGVPAEQRGGRLGRLSSAQMAGIVAGPLAGTGLYAAGGLSAPFLTLSAATLVVLAALALVPSSSASAAPAEPPLATAGSPALLPGRPRLASRDVLALLVLAVAAQVPTGLYDALWSRLLTDRGAGTLLIGLSLTLFGIPFVALAPLGGRLAGRRAPLRWAAAALVVASCFMASYGYVPSPVVITVLGAFEACAQSVAVPGGYAAVAATFPDQWSATGQGWFSAAGTSAAGVAAVVGAPAYAALGPGPVFAAGAAISVGCVALSVALGRRRSAPPVPAVRSAAHS